MSEQPDPFVGAPDAGASPADATKAHFTCSTPERLAELVELHRLDAEKATGRPMKLKKTRQTHYKQVDPKTGLETANDVYELWAEFEEAPELVAPPLNVTA